MISIQKVIVTCYMKLLKRANAEYCLAFLL